MRDRSKKWTQYFYKREWLLCLTLILILISFWSIFILIQLLLILLLCYSANELLLFGMVEWKKTGLCHLSVNSLFGMTLIHSYSRYRVALNFSQINFNQFVNWYSFWIKNNGVIKQTKRRVKLNDLLLQIFFYSIPFERYQFSLMALFYGFKQ